MNNADTGFNAAGQPMRYSNGAWTVDYAPEIGKRFVTILEEWLTPEEFEEVRTRNDTRRPGTCASHDFCDANEAMEQAMVEVQSGFDAWQARDYSALHTPGWDTLWTRAWDWAIEHYLSHSATAVALESEGYPEAQS